MRENTADRGYDESLSERLERQYAHHKLVRDIAEKAIAVAFVEGSLFDKLKGNREVPNPDTAQVERVLGVGRTAESYVAEADSFDSAIKKQVEKDISEIHDLAVETANQEGVTVNLTQVPEK